jgi:hypothetical protein
MILRDLFTRNDEIGKDFRNNIRAYNSIFAFTSMGVKLDENLANGRNSVKKEIIFVCILITC